MLNALLSTEKIPDALLRTLASAGATEQLAPGASVSTAASAFRCIEQGEVDVIYAGENIPSETLDAGTCFDLVGALSGSALEATLTAKTPTRLVSIAPDEFARMLAADPALNQWVMITIARASGMLRSHVSPFLKRSPRLNGINIFRLRTGPLITRAPSTLRLAELIKERAARPHPILVTGAKGTGKVFVASKIIEASGMPGLWGWIDARLRGSDALLRHFLASSALPFILIKHIDRLPLDAQRDLHEYLASAHLRPRLHGPSFIATSSADLTDLVEKGAFDRNLAAILLSNTVKVPELKDRRHDILPLAECFLMEGSSRKHLGRGARGALMAHRYEQGNAKELRETVQLAGLFAESSGIGPQHIATSPKDSRRAWEIDLTELPFFRWVSRPETLAWIRGGLSALFIAIMALNFLFHDSLLGKLSNAFLWSVWQPVLIFGFLFTGRLWCMTCPLGSLGAAAKRLIHLNVPAPAGVKQWGLTLGAVGLILIFWVEHLFAMPASPFASAVLLLVLLVAAMILAMVYERQVWCRNICPLGLFASTYSASSMLEVRANAALCAANCTNHECLKGTDKNDGCPVLHHPLHGYDVHACKLCMRCISTCPHGSTRLFASPAFSGITSVKTISPAMLPVCLSVFFLSLMILLSENSPWLQSPLGITLACAGALAAGMGLTSPFTRLFRKEAQADPSIASRVAFSLMVLGWGPMMAYQVEFIPLLSDLNIQATSGTFLATILPELTVRVKTVIQATFIGLSTGMWFYIGLQIRYRLRQVGATISRATWIGLLVLSLLYSGLALLGAVTR